MASPSSTSKPTISNFKNKTAAKDLASRVKKCWELDFDWSSVPPKLTLVSLYLTISLWLKKKDLIHNKFHRLANK